MNEYKKQKRIGLIISIIIMLLILLMSCQVIKPSNQSKVFYEVVDRQMYSKDGFMFNFRLYKYVNGRLTKKFNLKSNANWEVTDIIYSIEK